jgi:hypothetical protein
VRREWLHPAPQPPASQQASSLVAAPPDLALLPPRPPCRRFDGPDLYGLLVGLHWLRYHPGSPWLHGYTATLASKVARLSPGQHAAIVSLLRGFGYSAEGKPYDWVLEPDTVAALCGRV